MPKRNRVTPALRQAVRHRLRQLGWTQAQLSERTGDHGKIVGETAVSRLLNAELKTLSSVQIAALEGALGIELRGLLEQRELQLEIVRRFLPRAVEAIDEHVLRAEEDLASGLGGRQFFATVSLEIDQHPGRRIFEKVFSVGRARDE